MENFIKVLISKVNGGIVLKSIETDIMRKYRNGPFCVPKISLMMDECYQSSIGLSVLEKFSKLIRSVKLVGVKNVIPSRSVVQKYNNWLSAGMSLKIRHKILFDGAGCVLDIADCLDNLIEASQSIQSRGFTYEESLLPDFDPSSKAIVIAATNDGAKCSATTGMILYCIKFPDLELLQEFKNGKLNDSFSHSKSIELESNNINEAAAMNINWTGVQSMKYLGLVGWLEGDDNVINNRILGYNMYFYLNQAVANYIQYKDKYYNFNVVFPADMKAIWVSLGYGGSSHATLHYCWMCCSRNHDRANPSFYRCKDCVRLE
jgi:hypothetical protein